MAVTLACNAAGPEPEPSSERPAPVADSETASDAGAHPQDPPSERPPVTPQPPTRRRAVQVAVHERIACARMDDGGVRCWGQRQLPGESNPPAAATAVQLAGVDDAIDVGVGRTGVWVLSADGRVRVGSFEPGEEQPWQPKEIELGVRARVMDVGLGTTVVGEAGELLTVDDELVVRSHGLESVRALDVRPGRGPNSTWVLLDDGHITQVGSAPLAAVENLAALFDGGCGRDRTGEVLCWDRGSLEMSVTRQPELIEIGRAGELRCELGSTHELRCTPMIALAHDAEPPPLERVEIPKVASFAIHAGQHAFACTILADDGAVMCWGDNCDGQLGDGTLQDHAQPALVLGLHELTLPPMNDGRAAADEPGPEMVWDDAPKGCEHAAELPLSDAGEPLRVVSAYARWYERHRMSIRIADFRSSNAPELWHRTTRGGQRELVLSLVHEKGDTAKRIDRGEYSWLQYGWPTSKGRAVTAELYHGDSNRYVSDGLVLSIDTLTKDWVCGEIQRWEGMIPLTMGKQSSVRFAARIVGAP